MVLSRHGRANFVGERVCHANFACTCTSSWTPPLWYTEYISWQTHGHRAFLPRQMHCLHAVCCTLCWWCCRPWSVRAQTGAFICIKQQTNSFQLNEVYPRVCACALLSACFRSFTRVLFCGRERPPMVYCIKANAFRGKPKVGEEDVLSFASRRARLTSMPAGRT